ncbi:MAG: SGNH/GDSL hydrolase family protein [Marinagarivorans sp.]
MFIGASVTCGALAEPGNNCALNMASHNGRVAHGTLIAKALDAESQLICRSGRGILNGSLVSIPQDAVHFLDYILTTPEGPVYWDHRLFTPDGIIIALGNNDDLNNEAAFINAYTSLLSKLRGLFPDARILLTEGPLISGDRKIQLTGYLQTVVSSAQDTKISYIPSQKYPNSPCNDHPDAQTHEAIAKELLPLIKEKLGW